MLADFPICIQARLKSKRLPLKVCLALSDNLTVLDYLIYRLIKIKNKLKFRSKVYLLVPNSEVSLFSQKIKNKNVVIFGGPEHNLSKRFYEFLSNSKFIAAYRITADNPFMCIDPFLIIQNFLKDEKFSQQKLSNSIISLYPQKKLPNGLVISLLGKNALKNQLKYESSKKILEHIVTKDREYFEYYTPSIPKHISFPNLRFCIDNAEDFIKVSSIAGKIINDIYFKDLKSSVKHLNSRIGY